MRIGRVFKRLATATYLFGVGITLAARAAEPPMHSEATAPTAADPSLVRCVPATKRSGRGLGCFIIDSAVLGELPAGPLYWYIDTYGTHEAAEHAKGKYSRVVESYGKVWLFTIGDRAWKSSGGQHIARVGPLPLRGAPSYAVDYMEATFVPGMHSIAHRHPGPEAWYVLSGEQCLETPGHRMIVRAGESGIVPEGPPMMLFGTGTSERRSLVLVLHDASKPMSFIAPDWKPAGLCAGPAGAPKG